MERLFYELRIGHHVCNRAIGDKLLGGTAFNASENDADRGVFVATAVVLDLEKLLALSRSGSLAA